MPTENKEQVEAAARSVQGKGVDIVLAKLGTKGSMLIQKDETLNQGILKADKVCLLSHMLPPTNEWASFSAASCNVLLVHLGKAEALACCPRSALTVTKIAGLLNRCLLDRQ
jgi:hypothetical protein